MKPIIFSTKMIHTILDGRKTQTRRVIKPQPIETDKFIGFRKDNYKGKELKDLNGLKAVFKPENFDGELRIKAKYEVGDILWVRETWCCDYAGYYQYKAAWKDDIMESGEAKGFLPNKWQSSMFMPKKAARLFLTVTGIRVERIKDISNADAKAEGIDIGEVNTERCSHSAAYRLLADNLAIAQYADLWNKLNAKRGYGWDTNPWVFVYEFERAEKPKE